MSVSDTTSAVTRPQLFDTARGLYCPKPALRGWLHLLWFEASLVLALSALIGTQGATQTTAVAIYTATPPPPAIFGYHEAFHTYVGAAAACQYIAITLLIM